MPVGHQAPLFLLLALTVSPMAKADEEENWARLRSMPREHRQSLSQKLREFDRLPSNEKAAIRALDQELNSQPTANRANFQSMIRRYHLWLQTLSEDQRNQIEATPVEERMAAVVKLRAKTKANPSEGESHVLLQVTGPSPTNLATLLQTWMSLTPKERNELEKLDPTERTQRIRSLARAKKQKPIAPLTDAQLEASLHKMKADPQLTAWISRIETNAASKAATAKKQGSSAKKADMSKNLPNPVRVLTENYHFLIQPPKKVESSKLVAFESSLPSWFRASFDHFSPQEARRRLTILYRLIYGELDHPGASPSEPSASESGEKAASTPKNTPAKGASTPSLPQPSNF